MSLSPIECMASSALLTLASSTGGDAATQQQNSNQSLACRPLTDKYVSSGQLPKHHANVHKEERPFNCDVCDKTFRKGSDLKRHLRIHTGERPYVCETCSRAFAEAGSLHRHERCHTGEKPFACSVCNQLFCRAYNARKHTLKHDPSEGATVITVIMLEKAAPIKLKERSTNLISKSMIDREMDILAKASVSYKMTSNKLMSPDGLPLDS